MPVPVAGEYWLIHPTDANLNIGLKNVTEDSFEEEWEETSFNLINKGRKRDHGTRWGFTGSLTAQVWDTPEMTARAARLALEALRAEQTNVTLQTPFGDNWNIVITSVQVARTPGVGLREFHDVTLGYEEVFVEAP